jgi:integrase
MGYHAIPTNCWYLCWYLDVPTRQIPTKSTEKGHMALTDTFVRQVKPRGSKTGEKHSDGGGMYLHVTQAGKYWRLAYRYLDKQKTLALGVYPDVTLAKARQRREKARADLADGKDPSTTKREDKLAKVAASENTFKAIALEWHAMKSKGAGAERTKAKRLTQLENHIFPAIGNTPIADVKPAEVLAMLQGVAAKGTAYTATRLREICGQVFRFAIQTGRATNDPAAAMRGAIEKPAVNHRPALTTRREFGEFVRDLKTTTRAQPLTKLCARFGLLTWTRPGELRQAKWAQIDLEAKEWRIPAIEMKTGKHLQAHTVHLSPAALALLPALRELSGHTDRLFPSNGNAGGYISENTINGMFKRIGYKDRQSHHGLRASARSLLSERGWQTEALERQLDHKEADKAVAAYARSQHLVERRKFMDDWGSLIEVLESGDSVIPLRGKAA